MATEIDNPRASGRLLDAGLRRLGVQRGFESSFVVGVAGAFGIKAVGTLALLVLQIVLARILGAEGYGTYAYVYSWLNILTLFAALGFDTASLRFVAQYSGGRQLHLLRGYLRYAGSRVVLASLGVTSAMALSVWLLRARLGSDLTITFLVGALALPLLALVQLGSSVLRGLQRVVAALAPQAIVRPVLVLLAAALWMVWQERAPSPAQVMFLEMLVALLLALGVLLVIRRALPGELWKAEPSSTSSAWIGASLPLLLIAGSRLVMNRTDVVMVGLLDGTTSAGFYAAAVQLSGVVSFGLFAVSSIAAPVIADLHDGERRGEMQRVLTLSAVGAFSFSLLAGGALVLGGPLALSLYGAEFRVSFVPLVVLVVGHVLNSMTGPAALALSMTGYERVAAKVTVVVVVLNVTFNALLIPRYGPLGAAVATVISGTLWNLCLVAVVVSRLGFDPTVLSGILRRLRGRIE